jgi:cytosol alanyl aminopeptidase
VVPLRYDVRLRVVPDKGELGGTAKIALDVRKPVTRFWLHAVDLELRDAKLGGVPLRLEKHGEQTAFIAASPLAVGRAELTVAWSGKISEIDYAGVFRQEVDQRWYVFTQFESIEARRALPCFDEPRFKVPWRLTLEVPKDHVAASNAPTTSEKALGDMKEVVFAETPALPTYLYAFVVGPFDVVDGGVAGANRTPLRYLVTKGRGPETAFAASTNGKVLELHEDYYGIPYPFAKLDSVAIPQFGGAMENPGLITYGAEYMLFPPGNESIDQRAGWVSLTAHEQAHQWFGDLVTMSWWDDIWLNESFASWAGEKVTARMMPTWDPRWATVYTRALAMHADSLASARKIRQPVDSNDGIGEAFDRITYEKGQMVLTMIEAWVGEAAFQKGVRAYLTKYARQNTTSTDFLTSIGEGSGQPELPSLMATFLEQGGLPSVRGTLVCTKDGPASVTLSQERFLEIPREGDTSLWSIPLCVRTTAAKACTVLKEKEATIALPGTRGCPRWLHLDVEQRGYYHASYSREQIEQLFAGWKELTPAERSGLVDDLELDVRRGRLQAAEVLQMLQASKVLASADDVVLARVIVLLNLARDYAKKAQLDEAFDAAAVKLVGARPRALGWTAKKNETDDLKLARNELVPSLATWGEPALVEEAVALADRVLAGDQTVPADVIPYVLGVSAQRRKLDIAPFLTAARTTDDGKLRTMIYTSLAKVRDPAALPAIHAFVLSPDFKWSARGATSVIFAGSVWPALAPSAIEFVETHFDKLASQLPKGGAFGDTSTRLVQVGEESCDAATRDRIARFFGPRNQTRDGGPRQTATVLEKIDACIGALATQRPGLEKLLKAPAR